MNEAIPSRVRRTPSHSNLMSREQQELSANIKKDYSNIQLPNCDDLERNNQTNNNNNQFDSNNNNNSQYLIELKQLQRQQAVSVDAEIIFDNRSRKSKRLKKQKSTLSPSSASSSSSASFFDQFIRYACARQTIFSYVTVILCTIYVTFVLLYFFHREIGSRMRNIKFKFSSNQFANFSTEFAEFQPKLLSSEYLIDTSACRIRAQPLFDDEIREHFVPKYDQDYVCDQIVIPFKIERVNFTSIRIDREAISRDKWICRAIELRHDAETDWVAYGRTIGPLAEITDFARFAKNVDKYDESGPTSGFDRWDMVKVQCSRWNETKNAKDTYTRIVPLIQHYHPRTATVKKPSVNIIALGLDSVSRLNFQRQLPAVRELLEREGFIPLYGYHKVGENSFPNLLPIFSGQHGDYYYNESFGTKFRFDQVPMIFAEASKRGYVTTFVEDMAPYGTFSPGRGGFVRQPTDYYLRQANVEIWNEIYSEYVCYQDDIEDAVYWSWLLDAFDAFRQRNDQAHFTFAHMSTLTHNYFNHAGYADRPYSRFLERLFAAGVHRNSVMVLFSDHAIRFGPFVNTSASIHEARLPFIYVYVPETLRLGPLDATQIRAILRSNQHRLTSHFDLHATFRHVLHANDLDYRADQFHANDEPYGRSLLAPIAENRTCEQAGIRPQYCTCFAYKSISISRQVSAQTARTIAHINSLLAPHSSLCFDLKLDAIYRAFSAYDPVTGNAMRLIHFRTEPNYAIFETILSRSNSTDAKKHRNYSTNGDNDDEEDDEGEDFEIINISRLDRYGDQSECVASNYALIQFCLCKTDT